MRVPWGLRFAGAGGLLGLALCAAARAQQWTPPTAEELAMTSFAQAPGAPAIYLDKSVVVTDSAFQTEVYVRLKVLTEKGRDYANVALPPEDGYIFGKIEARTIHPDGTIVPFTGSPHDKLLVLTGNYSEKSSVFTLPSVDVGSILEYRYTVRRFGAPSWYLQDELYVRNAHYAWMPTVQDFMRPDRGMTEGRAAWTALLPAGTSVKVTKSFMNGKQMVLDVHDLPPLVKEEDMPPARSIGYRVLFYETPYDSLDDFWVNTGKLWSEAVDGFVKGKRSLREDVDKIVSAGDSDDQKARKVYAFVMGLENTDFTRERTVREDQANGFYQLRNADDVLKRQRGNGQDLTLLFVSMARAAGLKAYVMGVADRERRLWASDYMSLEQMDDLIAIVAIDGKDVYFDPGERYCEPEHLAWRHTLTGGLRQTERGTEIARTPAEPYKSSQVSRVANLKIDETGSAEGAVTLTFTGAPALGWRQSALLADEASVKTDLRAEMESALPSGMEVEVSKVENLVDYDKPLKVSFKVKGLVGSATGKRLLIPADCFEANAKPRFTATSREVAVDLGYAAYRQDAVRYSFAQGLVLESSPEAANKATPDLAIYAFRTEAGKNSVTSYRDLAIGTAFILPKEYPEFHSFYATVQTKDQETIVLTRAPATASFDAGKKPGS